MLKKKGILLKTRHLRTQNVFYLTKNRTSVHLDDLKSEAFEPAPKLGGKSHAFKITITN